MGSTLSFGYDHEQPGLSDLSRDLLGAIPSALKTLHSKSRLRIHPWNPTLAHRTRKDGAPGIFQGLLSIRCAKRLRVRV